MRSNDLPYNSKVPPKLQYRLPKVRHILSYHKLMNPTVRQRKEDGVLVFKVDSLAGSPLATIAAEDQISEFLGEEVIVMRRGADPSHV